MIKITCLNNHHIYNWNIAGEPIIGPPIRVKDFKPIGEQKELINGERFPKCHICGEIWLQHYLLLGGLRIHTENGWIPKQ